MAIPLAADAHYMAGLKFFDDPGFKQDPGAALWTFSVASYNDGCLAEPTLLGEVNGPDDGSREREQPARPSDIRDSRRYIYDLLSEDKQAEALAARALELSEKNQLHPRQHFPDVLSVGRERNWAARPRVLSCFVRGQLVCSKAGCV